MTIEKPSVRLALLTLTFQTTVVGAGYLFAKTSIENIDALNFLLLRVLISGLVSGLILLFLTKPTISQDDNKKLFRMSIIAVPLNQSAFLFGIQYTSPAEASLLYALIPIFTYLISIKSGQEYFSITRFIGVMVAICGALIVLLQSAVFFDPEHMLGNLIIMIGALIWSYYTVKSRDLVLKYDPFWVTFRVLWLGMFWCLPLVFWSYFTLDVTSISSSTWFGIIYLALIGSVLSYSLWVFALKTLEPSQVAVFANGQPLMTMLLAVIFYHQPVTGALLLGGTVLIAGVFWTQSGWRWIHMTSIQKLWKR